MKPALFKCIRIAFKTLKAIVLFVAVYFLCYLIGSNYTVNDQKEADTPVEIFISSNGVHTDLIFPVKNALTDWDTVFPMNSFRSVDSGFHYIAMGWGDKGFYIETPTWADLKASTAFKAMFFLGTSAMHITYHKNIITSENIRPIRISHAQYKKLIRFYKETFEYAGYKPQLIEGKGYTKTDNFYNAKGTYSFARTCNIFTNNALKNAGIKAPLWSPFAGGLIKHY